MRMSVIRNEEDRTQYYRTGVFRRDEDLVIFPFWEFEAFYQDLKHLHQLVGNVLEYGQNGERGCTPEDGIVHAQNYLERMEERLVKKLKAVPAVKRFIHAYILGREGRGDFAPLVAPVLVERLRDNHIRDDALMSMEALFRLGESAMPWMQEAIASADTQQRECIELLLWELADPAVTSEERARRRHLNKVTWKCDNPVQSWHYDIPAEY